VSVSVSHPWHCSVFSVHWSLFTVHSSMNSIYYLLYFAMHVAAFHRVYPITIYVDGVECRACRGCRTSEDTSASSVTTVCVCQSSATPPSPVTTHACPHAARTHARTHSRHASPSSPRPSSPPQTLLRLYQLTGSWLIQFTSI